MLNKLSWPIRSMLVSSASMVATAQKDYYRQDGVRIAHDPFAPGMAEKYGMPGATDNEGFDPYRDSVGPGIYGGIVKREQSGQVLIGRQYQNHNPRPGPVYAGGGYTPINSALGDDAKVASLLDKFPDLVNDVSTGGAQPLHMCGMSRSNQHSTALLIERGADIEALDTYGMTPLHRMASNNLAAGAQALLEAGADPNNRGLVQQSPMEIARASAAHDVMTVLRTNGGKRRPVHIARIVVGGAAHAPINGEYVATSAETVPAGFDDVCRQQGWSTEQMWKQLNRGATWFRASNGAYIYWNQSDQHWWIDEPSGAGVFKAQGPAHAPPQLGWKSLGKYGPPPNLVGTLRIPGKA